MEKLLQVCLGKGYWLWSLVFSYRKQYLRKVMLKEYVEWPEEYPLDGWFPEKIPILTFLTG